MFGKTHKQKEKRPIPGLRGGLLAALVLGLLAPPFALGSSYSSFSQYGCDKTTTFGTAAADCKYVSPSRFEFNAEAWTSGKATVNAWVGTAHAVNSGDTLPAYYDAAVRFEGRAGAYLTCVSVPQENDAGNIAGAQLKLYIQNYRAGGFQGERKFYETDETECLKILDFSFSEVETFRFYRGETHSLRLRAYGLAIADLYSKGQIDAWKDWYDSGERGFYLTRVAIPNQAPYPASTTGSSTWATQLLSGTKLSGKACDFDGWIKKIRLSASGTHIEPPLPPSENNPERTWSTATTSCRTHEWSRTFALPGTYTTTVTAWDNEDVSRSASGSFKVCAVVCSPLVPVGQEPLPTLEANPDTTGDVLVAESLYRPDGSEAGTRVTGAGLAVDTLGGRQRQPGDLLAVTTLDREAKTLSLVVNGVPTWSGPVEQTGADWYDVEPVQKGLTEAEVLQVQEALAAAVAASDVGPALPL